MKRFRRFASIAALGLPLLLSGCWVISTNRRLPVPKAPTIVQSVTPDELVAQMNQRWASLDTMTAKVEIQASVLKTKQGVATDYTTVGGNILFRKPEMLRVLGRAPVIGLPIFDMASDGNTFTLYIPSKKIAYKGSTLLKKKSKNQLENLRPGFFLDALVVQGLEPDDFYSVTSDSETLEDSAKKHLYFVPEYILSITRHTPGSHRDKPVRVVTFHREDLLPYEQDLYDANGNLETHVSYINYQDFGSGLYPSTINQAPEGGFQIVITVESVKENQPLKDNQFHFDIPEGTEIQKLH